MRPRGIKILQVSAGSAAQRLGLEPGDRLLEIDGHEVDDELALRFFLAGANVSLRVRHQGGDQELLRFDASEQEDLGIEVEEFQTRKCSNACIFCFVDQLPPGVRPSLKIRDDDYRLSFLHGNYITLTNLSEKDIARIIEQRISPLYISVHATEPDLRSRILGRKKGDHLLATLRRLVNSRIRLHAQVVLMPGINDGSHLDRTVSDLFDLYPGVQSVAVVPVGLSDYTPPERALRPVTPGFCRRVIRQAAPWQNKFRGMAGESFLYLGDEFYLQGGVPIPDASLYDEFSQIEDGVGMVRTFVDAFDLQCKRRKKRLEIEGTLVTGRLFYATLLGLIDRFNRKFGARLRVCGARNVFLGNRITVAGLLSGSDILKALRGRNLGDFIVIPQDAVSKPGGILLDDASVADLSRTLGKPVYTGGATAREFHLLMHKLAGKP
jgi:putative radical SAM enzyme (TIGR03279 family)